MKENQLPQVYYRGNELVLVQKAPDGFGAGSVVCIDANADGVYEYETTVGKDGVWCLSFEFAPANTNKQGLPTGSISMFTRTADGTNKTAPYLFQAIQETKENLAKAIPVNCAIEVADGPTHGIESPVEPEICACTVCSNSDTLLGSSLEGFSGSYTPTEYGVETATGKYRNAFPITSFSTRMLGFNLNLHHASMVKYDGPVGQSFSHSFNMMIVRTDEFTGQVVTPDLRIFDIYSNDGSNWHLPKGFYSRLCSEPDTHRWILTHHSGLEINFYQAIPGCPGYPVSIREPNGNTACMTYDCSGCLQEVITDLGQIQVFRYDTDGRLTSYSDHINRTWQFPHDGEGRLSGITTPVTTYANIPAGREISDNDFNNVMATQERCWLFRYQDEQFPNQITAEIDPRGATYRENAFNSQGRVIKARINGTDVRFAYDAVDLPLNLGRLEAGNLVRAVTDREGNMTYQELHGFQGGPKNGLGRFGLRRSITLTERGKGNPPLREDEPNYWEQRWLQDCNCLVPIVATQMFSSNDLPEIQFDEFGMPTNTPRETYTFNRFRQKLSWSYTDGSNTITNRWKYQRHGFGDQQQFSRILTETDAREFDDNSIYAGINFIHAHRYDEFGNHIQHDSPTVSLGTLTPQKISEQWTYNASGQPLSQIDANGNITAYDYFEGNSVGGDINTRGRFGGYLKSTTRGAKGSAGTPTKLVKKYSVNALGMRTRTKDEKGFVYETDYNDLQEAVNDRQPSVTLSNGRKVRYETRRIFDGAGNTALSRRTNIDADGRVGANAWIDRSASFDVVNNPLSERVEVDANAEHDRVTEYAYDNNDDQIIVRRPEGNRSFTVYDERRLAFKSFYGVSAIARGTETQGSGDPLRTGYPADKRALKLDQLLFAGLSISHYDARYNLVRVRDGRGNFVHKFFDFYNREVGYSCQNGNGWTREYDDASNMITESRGAVSRTTGQITELLERDYTRYDETGRAYQKVRDIDLGTDESHLLDPDDGKNSSYLTVFDPGSRVVTRIDANGNTKAMAYDAANRLLGTTDALGNQKNNTYDANSNLISVTMLELPGPGAAGEHESYFTTFVYDEINRRTEQHIRGLSGNAIDHAWYFGYDSRNNRCFTQDPENNFTLTTYDDDDRQVMMQRFDGNPFAASAIELIHSEWGYDRNNNLTEERRLSDVSRPGSIQISHFAYDDLDRTIRAVFPDSDDLVDGEDSGADRSHDRIEIVYDENSNPVQVKDQRAVVFHNRFDPGNRPVEQTNTLPEAVPGTSRQTFVYDVVNRITDARNNYAEVNQLFDSFSRLISETQSIRMNGTGFDIGWEQPIRVEHRYDKQGNRLGSQVRDQNKTDLQVANNFDSLNRHDCIAAAYFDKPMHPIARYAYLGPGRVQRKTLGNAAVLSCTYDSKRRLRTHQWTSPNRLLAGFEYHYDRTDNALFERFNHDMGLCDHFQYNDRYEVTGVTYRVPGSTPPPTAVNTFEYDDVFNRQRARFGSPFGALSIEDGYSINKANEYTQLTRNGEVIRTEYDAAGNTTRFPVAPVTANPSQTGDLAVARWDAYNLLFSVDPPGLSQQQEYRYDPMRRRISTAELDGTTIGPDSRRYIYDGWSVIEERLFDRDATLACAPSSLERIYVNGIRIDEPLLTAIDRNQDGMLGSGNAKNLRDPGADQEYYFLSNRLGSTMALLSADDPDRVLEYYRYDVYGIPTVLPVVEDGDRRELTPLDLSDNFVRARQATPGFGNSYLFTGRRFDYKTNLYYYRNRYYEPASGRFLQRDPVGSSDNANLYAYVNGNPVTWVDPLGTSKVSVDFWDTDLIWDNSIGNVEWNYDVWCDGKGEVRVSNIQPSSSKTTNFWWGASVVVSSQGQGANRGVCGAGSGKTVSLQAGISTNGGYASWAVSGLVGAALMPVGALAGGFLGGLGGGALGSVPLGPMGTISGAAVGTVVGGFVGGILAAGAGAAAGAYITDWWVSSEASIVISKHYCCCSRSNCLDEARQDVKHQAGEIYMKLDYTISFCKFERQLDQILM